MKVSVKLQLGTWVVRRLTEWLRVDDTAKAISDRLSFRERSEPLSLEFVLVRRDGYKERGREGKNEKNGIKLNM